MNRFSFIPVVVMSVLGLMVLASSKGFSQNANQKVVIGYVGGYSGQLNTEAIDATALTHINYAFVNVKNNRAFLQNPTSDSLNFHNLNRLKAKNPNLKILISLGGWGWSENFSDAVLTDTARSAFAASAVEIIARHGLDGVDIDWEYPAMPGEAGNVYRPEDKKNFTLMFQALRQKLDSLQTKTGKDYLLTAAVGGSQSFVNNTEMNEVHPYLDYINIMTYDYFGGPLAQHHTNLYASRQAPGSSADASVSAYLKAGVPASKLVIGIAFYGRGFQVESARKKGLNQRISSPGKGGGYSFIRDSLMAGEGYRLYWDRKAKAPFLFNKEKKQVVTFDDERSVRHKVKYVRQKSLAGVMFWQYYSDPKKYLIQAISKEITGK